MAVGPKADRGLCGPGQLANGTREPGSGRAPRRGSCMVSRLCISWI